MNASQHRRSILSQRVRLAAFALHIPQFSIELPDVRGFTGDLADELQTYYITYLLD
jgi:hypothetical protein